MGTFKNICPEELLVLATISSIIIADDLDPDDLEVLGQLFSTVGDSLSLIAAQREYLEAQNNNDNNNE
ncbi:hypothetical protein GCM10008905_10950 [Clostridium malenominatum]|uniref:DUF6774 domain-containing protein n=1 Tax=Clostridium malenominatum TaxID=1539 RepID=A0ABP3U2Q3_9CLOT